jgi:hypothetical protein
MFEWRSSKTPAESGSFLQHEMNAVEVEIGESVFGPRTRCTPT